MSKIPHKLLIVESPAKVGSIKKYLGKEYEVTASVGHTHSLPKKDFVDIKNGFKLNYEPDAKKKEVLKNIEKLAEKCDEIYYAQDMDIEGSVIAWNLYNFLLKKNKSKKHIRVNLKEITASGLKTALATSYPITDPKEFNIIQAGLLRRIEDRFVGFQLSPLSFIYVQHGTSAGRVQSPALRMIVDRQREIDAFIPEVYYEIFADVFPNGTKDIFTAKYTGTVTDEKVAEAVVAGCLGKPVKIINITKKQTKGKPPEPFITKTLLSAASTILTWKAERTTSVAQKLFQGGHITYLRTDNPVISGDGETALLTHIKGAFGAAYHLKSLPNYKNPDSKLEHECIRPTNLSVIPMFSTADETKLYELIRKRFLAAGLPAAIYDSTTIELTIGPHTFKASGSTLVFDGYLKEWDYNQKDDTILPPLDMTTVLNLRDCHHERKETKPPSRFKDASLIDALDKKGIGKPSTYAAILHLLEERTYIAYDKQSLVPTDLGNRLNDFLMKYFEQVIDFDFTARVEKAQDEVMEGKLTYESAVGDFHKNLKECVKTAQTKIKEDRKGDEATTHLCPKCTQHYLLKKINRKDQKEFYSCGGYMDKSCMATFAVGEDGTPVDQSAKREVLMKCPRHGCTGDLIKRMNKKTEQIFYACSEWKDGCKATADDKGEVRVPQALQIIKKCDKCKKGSLVLRTSKAGDKFLGCNNYPKCRKTEPYSE